MGTSITSNGMAADRRREWETIPRDGLSAERANETHRIRYDCVGSHPWRNRDCRLAADPQASAGVSRERNQIYRGRITRSGTTSERRAGV